MAVISVIWKLDPPRPNLDSLSAEKNIISASFLLNFANLVEFLLLDDWMTREKKKCMPTPLLIFQTWGGKKVISAMQKREKSAKSYKFLKLRQKLIEKKSKWVHIKKIFKHF